MKLRHSLEVNKAIHDAEFVNFTKGFWLSLEIQLISIHTI